MLDIKVSSNFPSEDELMRRVVVAAAEQFAGKLTSAGIPDVKVTPEKGPDGNWRFHLVGPDDQIQKARELIAKD